MVAPNPMMCAHPILPLFQATQAIAATIATMIIIIVDSIFFVNMPALASEVLPLAVSITSYRV